MGLFGTTIYDEMLIILMRVHHHHACMHAALQVMRRNPSDRAIEGYWSQATGDSLSYQQFSQVMQREKITSMAQLMHAFRDMDTDEDSFITAQELQGMMAGVSFVFHNSS